MGTYNVCDAASLRFAVTVLAHRDYLEGMDKSRDYMMAIDDERAFFAYAHEVIDAGRLRQEACFSQHGTTTTLLHSIAVAYSAQLIAISKGKRDHLSEICRAGLLHDYYLYDWHDGKPEHKGHATQHPARALANARLDYPDLTELECDGIIKHMYPLTHEAPISEVGWCITISDKLCAGYETRVRNRRAYPKLRALCAQYLQDVSLDLPGLTWSSKGKPIMLQGGA